MPRISYFLVMVFVIVTIVAGEAKSFSCDGPERKKSAEKCLPFVTAPQLQEPSAECCIAYRNFVQTAKTTADRRKLCSCTRARVNQVPVNTQNLDALQKKCGLPLPYVDDPNFDCNTVN
ncbi:hypothetical protein AgCh_013783 [Apium graveolens]